MNLYADCELNFQFLPDIQEGELSSIFPRNCTIDGDRKDGILCNSCLPEVKNKYPITKKEIKEETDGLNKKLINSYIENYQKGIYALTNDIVGLNNNYSLNNKNKAEVGQACNLDAMMPFDKCSSQRVNEIKSVLNESLQKDWPLEKFKDKIINEIYHLQSTEVKDTPERLGGGKSKKSCSAVGDKYLTMIYTQNHLKYDYILPEINKTNFSPDAHPINLLKNKGDLSDSIQLITQHPLWRLILKDHETVSQYKELQNEYFDFDTQGMTSSKVNDFLKTEPVQDLVVQGLVKKCNDFKAHFEKNICGNGLELNQLSTNNIDEYKRAIDFKPAISEPNFGNDLYKGTLQLEYFCQNQTPKESKFDKEMSELNQLIPIDFQNDTFDKVKQKQYAPIAHLRKELCKYIKDGEYSEEEWRNEKAKVMAKLKCDIEGEADENCADVKLYYELIENEKKNKNDQGELIASSDDHLLSYFVGTSLNEGQVGILKEVGITPLKPQLSETPVVSATENTANNKTSGNTNANANASATTYVEPGIGQQPQALKNPSASAGGRGRTPAGIGQPIMDTTPFTPNDIQTVNAQPAPSTKVNDLLRELNDLMAEKNKIAVNNQASNNNAQNDPKIAELEKRIADLNKEISVANQEEARFANNNPTNPEQRQVASNNGNPFDTLLAPKTEIPQADIINPANPASIEVQEIKNVDPSINQAMLAEVVLKGEKIDELKTPEEVEQLNELFEKEEPFVISLKENPEFKVLISPLGNGQFEAKAYGNVVESEEYLAFLESINESLAKRKYASLDDLNNDLKEEISNSN